MRGLLRSLLLLLLATGTVLSGREADRLLGRYRAQRDSLYLWSGVHVKRMFTGFENLMADVYWLRAVQYYGGMRSEEGAYSLLEPLLTIAVTLDPRLEIAYRYGAIFLSEPPPVGAGRPEAGSALLERGCQAMPLSWRLRQDRATLRFLFLGDVEGAADDLRDASHLPGAPYWLKTLAGEFLMKGGERQKARRLWQALYDSGEDVMRLNALAHLELLDALDQREAAEAAVAIFRAKHGRPPQSLQEAARAGLTTPLADPKGVPFDYVAETGAVSISTRSPLWRRTLQ